MMYARWLCLGEGDGVPREHRQWGVARRITLSILGLSEQPIYLITGARCWVVLLPPPVASRPPFPLAARVHAYVRAVTAAV